MRRVPERGDIWHIDLEPVRGAEQRGARPVLVLTRQPFNRRGLMMVCPVTQGGSYARDAGFAVPPVRHGQRNARGGAGAPGAHALLG